MQLPDGRLFEYSAAGDPGAELLVFCVGTPSAVVDFPYVAEAVKRGDLALHGAWFDIDTGRVLARETNDTTECYSALAEGPAT